MTLHEQAKKLLMETSEIEKILFDKTSSLAQLLEESGTSHPSYETRIMCSYTSAKVLIRHEMVLYQDKIINEIQESSQLTKNIDQLKVKDPVAFFEQLKVILTNLKKYKMPVFNLKAASINKIIKTRQELYFIVSAIIALNNKIYFYNNNKSNKVKNCPVDRHEISILIDLIEIEIKRLMLNANRILQKIAQNIDIFDDLLAQEVSNKMTEEISEIFSDFAYSYLMKDLKIVMEEEEYLPDKKQMKTNVILEIRDTSNKFSRPSEDAYNFLIDAAHRCAIIVIMRNRYKSLLSEWRHLYFLPKKWVRSLKKMEAILNRIEPAYKKLLYNTYIEFQDKIPLFTLRLFCF